MSVLLKKCCEAILKRKEGTALPYTVRKKLSQVQKKLWNEEDFSGTPFHRTSFAAACVELELVTCTYRENIKNINIIVNGGRLLNILSAEASIRLAVQKVLGAIVEGEQISAEKLKISFIQSEDEPSQIGELVYHVLPAAYSEALSQALGCTINSLPLATDTLYKRLQENKIHLLAKKRAEMEAAQKEAELKEAEQEEAAYEKENEDVAEEKSE